MIHNSSENKFICKENFCKQHGNVIRFPYVKNYLRVSICLCEYEFIFNSSVAELCSYFFNNNVHQIVNIIFNNVNGVLLLVRLYFFYSNQLFTIDFGLSLLPDSTIVRKKFYTTLSIFKKSPFWSVLNCR